MAQVWSEMPVDEKIIYTQMAEQEKIRYQKDLEQYVYKKKKKYYFFWGKNQTYYKINLLDLI